MNREPKEKLLSVYEKLSAFDQSAVASFAEFLLSRSPSTNGSDARSAVPDTIPEPEHLPRPDDEKVVAAVKRLSQTYFMLDKKKILGATSDLVTQHVVQGRDAGEVIDELESVFHAYYQQLKQGNSE
jgi:hypothetical protein